MALLAAFLLAFGGLVGIAAPAQAAEGPLTATVTYPGPNGAPGDELANGTELNPGTELQLNVGYAPPPGTKWADLAGTSIDIAMGGPLEGITPMDLGNNAAIASFEVSKTDPTKFTITFKDQIPLDTVDGYVFLKFKVGGKKETVSEPITWDLGTSGTGKVDVIVKGTESKPGPKADAQSKAVSNGNPDLFDVDQNSAGKTPAERVTIKANALDTVFTYTLKVESLEANPAYSIKDSLPAGLVLVEDSFTTSQTRWSSSTSDNPIPVPGAAFVPATQGATAFAGTLDVPAFSVTTITYKVKIKDQATLDAWKQDFVDQIAADENFEAAKDFTLDSLKNTATFGPKDIEKSATVTVKDGWGAMSEVGPDGAFGKSASPNYSIPVVAADGSIASTPTVEWKLTANLNGWDGSTALRPRLKENVIITDTLASNFKWSEADADFISATGIRANNAANGSANQLQLTEAAAGTTPAAFKGDAFVGQWMLDGDTLYVNVGKSQHTNATVTVKSTLVSVDVAAGDANKANTPGNVSGEKYYHPKNTASFTYEDKRGVPQTLKKDAEHTVVDQKDQPEGQRDENYFDKQFPGSVKVESGQPATVPFVIEAKNIKGFDPTKTTVVDYVDTNMFDLSKPEELKNQLKVSYNGASIAASDLDVKVNAETGEVEVKYVGAALELGKTLRVELNLQTYPVYGKQILEINNRSVLRGEDDQPDFWDEVSGSASNFGFEAQVKKTLHIKGAGKFTELLQPEIVDGEILQKRYVYRVQVFPRGNYSNVVMRTLTDELPRGTKFVGFVSDADMDDAKNATGANGTPYGLLQGNLEAVFQPLAGANATTSPGTIVLRQKAGTKFPANIGDGVWVNLAVDIISDDNDVPVINTVGGSSAVIVPKEEGDDTVPLLIPKLDAKDNAPLTDRSSEFLVKGTGEQEAFTATAFAEKGYLMVVNPKDPAGPGKVLRVPAAGSYEVTEVKAPYGYTAKNAEPIKFTVNAEGKITSPFKAIYNEPNAYALGDFVWIDSNGNGLQDADEKPLEGVKVSLLDSAGNLALDLNGNEVQPVATDANGRYVFDNLRVGDYRVEFELTDAQKKKYNFTKVGTDDAAAEKKDFNDSDAAPVADRPGVAQTELFTLGKFGESSDGRFTNVADYATELGLPEGSTPFKAANGIDQTRDAGVTEIPTVEVGNYVWFDANNDGIQGEDPATEPGIENVLLEVYGPNGDKLTENAFGEPLGEVRTNDKGEYYFKNLPVLEEGQSYTVKIVQKDAKTEEALKPYVPTKTGQGDKANDSSTWEASSEEPLIEGGSKDYTLDFGFSLKSYAVGDFTWIDANRDGKQDPNEKVLPGVKVTLTDADGNPVKDINGAVVEPMITNENGRYLFDLLPAGDYKVHFDISGVPTEALDGLTPDKFTFTTADSKVEGATDANDSDANRSTGWTATVKLDENTGLLTAAEYAEAVANGLPVKATNGVNPTLDAGIVLKSYAVGDYVWIDKNRDGVQDEGEDFLDGVTVTIVDKDGKPVNDVFGNPVESTTTKNGKYVFDNLPEGEYKVIFELTEDQAKKYRFTKPNAGEGIDWDPADQVDSDAITGENRAIGETKVFKLEDAEHLDPNYGVEATQGIDKHWDSGVIVPSYAIGDKVWFDENRDGIQDGDPTDPNNPEKPVPGVTVTLRDENGDPVKDNEGNEVPPTTTNEKGEYHFDNLPEGKYTVKFELPEELLEDYTFTTDDPTDPNPVKDSNPNPKTGITKVIELGPNNPNIETNPSKYPGLDKLDATEGIDPTVDAGIVKKSYAVGDITWIDTNRDGQQNFEGDSPEEILGGVKVEIFAITTDEAGNTVQSPVTDVYGNPVGPTTTDEKTGRYLFDKLPKGSYQVKFTLTEEQSKKYTFTTHQVSDETAIDSNADRVTGLTATFDLNDGTVVDAEQYTDQPFKATQGIDPTWDAGVVLKTYAIGDVVWFDENRDGVQDESEPKVPGVTVTLLDKDGKPAKDVNGDEVPPFVTTENGKYVFENLPSGDYRVKFELPEDVKKEYSFTTVNTGDKASTNDSDPNRATGITGVISLGDDNPNLVPNKDYEGLDPQKSTQGIDPTWDAGIVKKSYAIGDYTWIDSNKDGKQDKGEPILSGVKVTLLDKDGKPAKDILGNELAPVFTNEAGKYLFDELAPGDYQVVFELTPEQAKRYQFTSVGKGTASDSDAKPESGNPAIAKTVLVTLGEGNPNLTTDYPGVKASEGIDPTWDAGVVLKPSVSVGDYVWIDTNKNGRQDDGEPGIPGIYLEIFGPDGKPVTDVFGDPVKPVITDKNGKYTFENLPVLKPGEKYTVKINRDKSKDALKGFKPTTANKGDRTGDSSDWEASSEGLNNDGDRDPTLDFGFVPEDKIDVGGVGQTRPVATPTPTDDGIDVGGVGQTRPADTDATTTPAGEGTANTGLDSAWMGIGAAALLLMVIGGLAVTSSRRKVRRH